MSIENEEMLSDFNPFYSRKVSQVIIVSDDGNIYVVKKDTKVFLEAIKMIEYSDD